jgi:two-component system chemotaxis sensor kinase CheA
MHTLKGSASMFGLDSMQVVTHELETIYDSIRENRKTIDKEILSLSFNALDHLKNVLKDPELSNKKLKAKQEELLKAITKISSDIFVTENSEKEAEEAKLLYYVRYFPSSEELANGTNPFYIIEDLLSLGTGYVFPSFKGLPTLDQLNTTSNYSIFEVLMLSSKSIQELQENFMFCSPSTEIMIEQIDVQLEAITESHFHAVNQFHSRNNVIGLDAIQEVFGSMETSEDGAKSTEKAKEKVSSSSIRVDSDKIDELMNLISELVTTQAQLTTFSDSFNSPELTLIGENVEKITRRLRDNAFGMSLIPIETLIFRFKRLVRDLSAELNKEVNFLTDGTETEIDKSIVEKLTDPILHIIRNSLDHGIEPTEKRIAAGKSAQGTIHFKAYYSGANVVIEIMDDGAGISTKKIRRKAISKSIIGKDEVLTDKEILDLIFAPGFSTAESVTGVSGRGVGMDVVKRNISELRGEIEIDTKEGEGTTFKIILPLTLSIIDGLLVNVGDTHYILPLQAVGKCFEVETLELRNSFNQWVTLDGQRTPYIFLREEFELHDEDPLYSQVIKIKYKGNEIGLVVDSIVGEYQAVLKPLGEQYKKQDEFSGATILGDGSVALIIDPLRLTNKLMDNKLLSHNGE